jgi:hypothetical protein
VSVPFSRALLFGFILGAGAALFGCTQWVMGFVYHIAAERESSTVGQITKVSVGPRHTFYHYEFQVNSVRMSDDSEICKTPLKPAVCIAGGPALVYYSYEPFQNSLLEDFAVASSDAIQRGNRAWVVGVALMGLCYGIYRVFLNLNGRGDEPVIAFDTETKSRGDDPEEYSITPRD